MRSLFSWQFRVALFVGYTAFRGGFYTFDVFVKGASFGWVRGFDPSGATGCEFVVGDVHIDFAIFAIDRDFVACFDQGNATAFVGFGHHVTEEESV